MTHNHNAVPAQDYLAYVTRQIRLDAGHTPQTWKDAIAAYDHAHNHPPPTLADRDEARRILTYIRGQSPDDALTPHLADLVTCLNREHIRRDELALAASAALVYTRAQEREARAREESKRRQTSRHVGARGQEISITRAYILAHRDRPSPHTGRVHIYEIQDGQGNAYTYFASRPELEPGWTYDLLADVKRHEIYREIQKTIVGNVRIGRVVEEGSK